MAEGEMDENSKNGSHVKQLERCHCGPKKIESVSYSLPDDSFVSLTRCTNCGGLTDWQIRKHEPKSAQNHNDPSQTPTDESPTETEESQDQTQNPSDFSNFITFLGRETIALLIVGIGVTLFAIQWGLTMVTGAVAILSFFTILPLLYYTNREN